MQCVVITCGATDESAGHSEFKLNFCSQIGIYVTKYKIWHCMQLLTTLQYHPKTQGNCKMKISVCWNVIPCNVVETCSYF